MRPDPGFRISADNTKAGPLSTSTNTSHRWLGSRSIVLTLIGFYLIGHFALRMALSPTLGIDDAEQVLFAQQWAFGYRFRQPPLFTWLLVPVIDLVGPGILAVSIVRYSLLALTYVLLYLTVCRCVDDRRLAALSILSFSLIYVFAYYAHHDLTHTTTLGMMIAASFYVVARLVRKPTTLNYVMLGLCFGLGMLAKWNFAMLAVGLPLTCLALAGYRHLVLTCKSLVTMGVMAVVLLPTAGWMFEHGQSIRSVSDTILASGQPVGLFELMIKGCTALLTSTVLFPLPFLFIFLVIFGGSLMRGIDHAHTNQKTVLAPNFLGWLMLIILGLHVLLIPLFGAVNFTERWLHPALMILPLYLFALAERGRPEGRAITLYVAAIAILVAAVVGARLYRYTYGADQCGKCREFAPFTELADDLHAAGFTHGTIVADGMHIGGNLKMLFPDSRVIDPAFPLALWPPLDYRHGQHDGMCLLVWRDDLPGASARRDLIADFAIRRLGAPKTTPRKIGQVQAMMYGSSTRRYTLGFELMLENSGGCR